MTASATRKPVDWSRWLHDPRHWERFYDGLGIKTYAAIAKEIWDGERPEAAVDAAVETISTQMRRSGIPGDLVRTYREDYFRHRDQLIEVACEIWDVLPPPAYVESAGEAAAPGPAVTGWAGLPMLMFLGAVEGALAVWSGYQHEMERWSHLGIPHDEHRSDCLKADEARLCGHYGRRTHDVDVERL